MPNGEKTTNEWKVGSSKQAAMAAAMDCIVRAYLTE